MKLNKTLLVLFAMAGVLPPVVFRIISWYGGSSMSSMAEFMLSVLTSVITTLTISVGVVKVLIWLQQNHPWKKGIIKRLFLEVFLTTLTACTLIVLITLAFQPIRPVDDLQGAIFNYLIVALIMNFVLVSITEGVFFFQQWRQSAIDAERYKKDSIKAQFESLKNQVNPHFLFNSLNTLSGLIDHDQNMSKEFVDNLSSVYRYVLQHKDDEIVTIQTELDFVRAYLDLLKTRHGERISFAIDVEKQHMLSGIPPMTLQILVENAVKHNVASKKRPLQIEITSTHGMINVKNKKQLKSVVQSTKVGLKNIKSRYQYLTSRSVTINQDNGSFEVGVPILSMPEGEE